MRATPTYLDRVGAALLASDARWARLILLGLFLANALHAAIQNSGTCDELAAHIPSGYLYWLTGEFSGGFGNPPLGQLLIALPQKLFGFPYRLFSEDHLFWFRLPVMLMGLLLGNLVYALTNRLYGSRAALVSLYLYVLSPNILAHSTIATLDLPLTLTVLLTILLLARVLEHPGVGRVLSLGLALGGALTVKTTGMALVPVVLLALVASAAGWLPPARISWRQLALYLALLALSVCLVSGLCYLHAPTPGGGILPPALVAATVTKFSHATGGHFNYLWGRYSTDGWWYYFPVAILLKTPITTLILVFWGTPRRHPRAALPLVLLPVLAILVPAMLGRVNIGLRHVLSLYPFLLAVAGYGASLLWRWRRGGVLLTCLLVAYGAEAIWIAPHHLSYFNLLVGGPRNGHRYLIDSNYDWGQNDHFLRRHIHRTGLRYQINPDPYRPATGPILVNANALYGVMIGGEHAYHWLKAFEPKQQIAYTWFEYRIPDDAFSTAPSKETERTALLSELLRIRESARTLDRPPFRFRYAALLARLRAYDLAFEELGVLLKKHPTHQPSLKLGGELRVRYKLGALAFAGDEYLTGFHGSHLTAETTVAAEEVVRSAGGLGQRREWSEMYVELGLGQFQAGDRASAVACFRRALDFRPENAAARHNLKALGAAR